MIDINQNIQNNLLNFHLAGIIPVSGSDVKEGEVPWHTSLTRLDQNLLAIERSVLECNFAGCETIWIVCNEDIQPLIKHRVGDYITCLESVRGSRYVKYPTTKIEKIPIFYVPVPPRLRDKRDSLAWSILHGANESFMVSLKISKWVTPNKYFVSFPYGIYDPKVASSGKKIYFSEKNVIYTFKGESVCDNLYTAFTFKPEEFKTIRRSIKKMCSGMSFSSEGLGYWSSRNFLLDKFYNYDNIKSIETLKIEEYQSCQDWKSYQSYLKSNLFGKLVNYNIQNLNGTITKESKNERIKISPNL